VSAEGQNGLLPPLEIGTKSQKNVRKSEVSILIPVNRFNSCNNTLFTGMALARAGLKGREPLTVEPL